VNTEKINPRLTAIIVKSYLRQHRIRPDQLSDLITSVHSTLGQLGQPVQPEEVFTPAVSVRRSVHHDYVVCMDCGYRGQTLRRHISTQHGMTRDEYLSRWGLRSDHPLTAPSYSERRSTMAKAMGFGRRSTAGVAPAVTPTAAPATLEVWPPVTPTEAPTPVDVDQSSEVKPTRRRSRAASNSADVANDAVAATPTRRRGSRSRVASPQPEPPTAGS